jgi:hypothetical protein
MTISEAAIGEHYRRAESVYEILATVGDYPTIGLNDFVGWYIKRDHDDVEAIKAGYPKRGRVAQLDRDYDEIHSRLDRTLYAVTTYKTPTAFRQWEPYHYDESEGTTVWQNEPPTPGYADLRAVPAWGDIDLADDIKPQRDSFDAETQALVERTLDAYIEEYATLYGTPDAVYALDSVGGAYIFGAPEATLPIADHFSNDPDALERVFDAFLDRSNAWLQDAETRVNERINGAEEVIQPDWVNNKNRQYKPPLSIHADHDAVVTPIATDDIRYDLRPFAAVNDALIEQAVSWADDLTRVEHTDCVDSLVGTLWPDLYAGHDGWRATLEAWIEAERERERERLRQREAALQRRDDRLAGLDGTLEGRPITPFKNDVYEAVEAVDIDEIARHYASDAYDTDPNQPRPQFNPCWRHSESGQSCFVDEQANTFGDSKVNAGGGPAKLMALATGIISDADSDLDGEDYWAAVDELRSAGYDIPVWIPEAGSDRADGGAYDQMPFWAIRKAAIALEVCPEEAFVDREGEDGTYEGFPGQETYNEALAAIEEVGLDHGREPVTPEETYREDVEPETDTSEGDGMAGNLNRAHLREKNRLLAGKIERLEAELDEKSQRIDSLEAKVDRLQAELDAVRSERDRLETVLENRLLEQESNQKDESENQSPLDKAIGFVSFNE